MVPMAAAFKLKYHGNSAFWTFPNYYRPRLLNSTVPWIAVTQTEKPVQAPKLSKFVKATAVVPICFDP